MTLWIDAQLSPALANWVAERFGVVAIPVKMLGLLDAWDAEIIRAGRRAQAVVMTKEVLAETLQPALDLLRGGKPLVEVRDRPRRSVSG